MTSKATKADLLKQHFFFQRAAREKSYRQGHCGFRTVSRTEAVERLAKSITMFYGRDLRELYETIMKNASDPELDVDLRDLMHFLDTFSLSEKTKDQIVWGINNYNEKTDQLRVYLERVMLEDFLGAPIRDEFFIKIRLCNTLHLTIKEKLTDLLEEFMFHLLLFPGFEDFSRIFDAMSKLLLVPDVVYTVLTAAEQSKIMNKFYPIGSQRGEVERLVTTCLTEMYVASSGLV